MSVRATATVRSVSSSSGSKIVAAGRVNTIGLAERELMELLELMDSNDTSATKGPVRRDFARWPFRRASVALKMIHPGGTEVELRLACRNLSRGGACLLHNGFVHTGTACRVMLPRLAGGFEDLAGVICRCSHRRGTLHEIGVKFNQPVDLKRFVSSENVGEVFSLERVAPEKLKGRLLLVEECAMNVRIVQHYLRETQMLVTQYNTAAEAMSVVSTPYDVVMIASALPDMKGLDLLAQMREAGVEAPVMLMTADEGVAAAKAAMQSDPNLCVLAKPLQHDVVLRSIAERLLVSTPAAGGAKESKKAAAVPTIGPELLAELVRTNGALRQAATEASGAKALPLCLILKGAAGALEYPPLTAAATKAA